MEKTFVYSGEQPEAAIMAMIEQIPDSWAVLRGSLRAPKELLGSGQALASTKLVFGSPIDQMIAPAEQGQRVDIVGIILEQKKPKSIEFGQFFRYCEVMPMAQSKRLAVHFVALKYRGRLTFRYRDPDDDEEPFGCEIRWPQIRDGKDFPPTFTISNWNEDLFDEKTIPPIMKELNKLGFKEKNQ